MVNMLIIYPASSRTYPPLDAESGTARRNAIKWYDFMFAIRFLNVLLTEFIN